MELVMHQIIQENLDHVVGANEGVIGVNNVHFARVKGCPGNQVLNMAKSVKFILHHVSGKLVPH